MSSRTPYIGPVHYEPKSKSGLQYRTNMTQRDEVQKFEQGRIRFLQEERLHIQKKTFTKWMNSFLQKARLEVDDLFVDLADGKKLLKLLEIISGEKLAKPNNGKMRVHKIENVNKSLAFLHTKVRLESIGAEDIVDGNPRLILGLIWTIILRFQIQEIEIDVDEENESSEKKSAKDALLLWAQRKTHGYPNVDIKDFSSSWRTGLGFNALIHAHRPDLFDFNSLVPGKNIDNLNHAFDVANNELGIPRLLDAEDIDNSRPDEKSIMTYVASYYHTFARMKNEEKSGRRIAKIIKQMADADKMKIVYDKLTTTLLDWIKSKTVELEDRNFPNSLEGIQVLLVQFGQYRTKEKPPKYIERSEIEALFFNINTQLKELRQPAFNPVEGKLVQDIERAWEVLERAEHSREVDLRSELRRQERLEQLYYKFERKSVLREGYLKEMIQVLSDPRYGSNLAQVDATLKKHEAISADILAREERVHDLTQMCNELVEENYRNSERVKKREDEILKQWKDLLALLEKHKFNLNRMGNIMTLSRDIDTSYTSIQQLTNDMLSTDTGVHLMAVEELLQKHALQELQVTSLGETEKRLSRSGENIPTQNPKEQELLKKKLAELSAAYKNLQDATAQRRNILEEARNFYQFLQDQEDEEAWLIEKQRICQAGITAKDLRGVLSLQQKHKALMDEIKARKNKYDRLGAVGRQLMAEDHPRSSEIEQHMERNEKEWKILDQLANERAKQLQDAAEAYQFYADANEADSWLNEKTSILNSNDVGTDEPSAQALLQRHKDLEGELDAYKGDIQSLNTQADRLIAAGISHLDLTPDVAVSEPQVEETIYEYRMTPTEVWEDEPVEKVEYKMVTQERRVPQVKALYPFSDHGLTMIKGEVMYLLNKSNPDWWCVRKADGKDGFAPANYVVEVEPRLIQIQVKQPETVKTTRKVKKTKMIKQKVPVKILRQPKPVQKKMDDSVSVPKRQKNINDTYQHLQDLATERHALLEDAIRLFRFYKECDDFERWIKDKEKLLATDDANDTVEQAKRKYEKFVTDLSASSKRMDELDAAVVEFEQQKHSQIDKVRARHRQVQAAWQRLNKLKAEKEKSLEGASSVELFYKTCDEAKDWMSEKMMQLDADVLGHDLKTVQALQRRHDNLERELAPVEEKVNKVMHLANSVKSAYPNERKNVSIRQDEIQLLWQEVKDKASKQRARLEDAVGQQIFTNSCKDLLHWVEDVKDRLNADNTVRDVQTAEELLKNHQDLKEEIAAKNDEFNQLTHLGKKLLKSNPELVEISESIARLTAEQEALARGWKAKQLWLEQCLQLQLFNKEADNIDAATSAHQAFLEFSDLGTSLDEVEALQKQHRAFVNTLSAQDDRVNAFSKRADALIADKHYDAKGIDSKRNQVLERRQAVKDACQQRTNALDASKNYQEFRAEVEDLRNWLAEKLKTASDESYRDLSNLERKLQKHEAFERELRANEGQLRTVNKLGQSLIAQDNYRKEDVAQTLKELNDEWQKLVGLSLEKGRRLRQAVTQHDYNNSIDDVNNRLNDIDKNLQSANVGNDLRSCRELLKRHEALENEMALCESRVNELVDRSNDMAHDDHFDTDAIRQGAVDSQKRLQELNAPAQRRRDALEEAMKFYKFGFEINTELQWINEHLPLACSDTLGQNLHQAQNLFKKHKKLEAEIVGHQPVIDKTLAAGQNLIDLGHNESEKIQNLCDELQTAWTELYDKAKERAQKLELSLKAQQFFFEANEVESWLNEKADILTNTDYGRDRDSATKLLTKHKALELELDTYKNIITEMGRGAFALIQNKHPESKVIAERQSSLEHLVRSLQRKAALRQHRLMESLFRHEYFLESEELERWIAENLQQASSEDYGQDYEHLLVLQAKFDDLKHRIEAGSERFRQCEDLAQKLISGDTPYLTDIEEEQQHLDNTPSEAVEEVKQKHEVMRESWAKLHEQLNNREHRLLAAGEIHRFHRDVADAMQRIHEKSAALGSDLGRDLNSALALLRKHESFENELVALEAQLQVLVEDASKLQKIYPNNKKNIHNQQELVVKAWDGLRERADLRHDQLRASVDLQKFLTQVRDLTNWATGLRLAMGAEENIRSAARAQVLRGEHEALKGEIEARENDFREVGDYLNAMEQTGHYAAPEAVERYRNLLQEREKLHTAWQLKKIHLDQLCDLHMFLREAKLIEDATNAQEATLGNIDFGETVDQVTDHVKKHEAFEKLMSHQDEKLETLIITGQKLINQKHFDSDQIANRLEEIKAKRKHVHRLCAQRKRLLGDALLYAEFNRDVEEARSWIADRQKSLDADAKTGEAIGFEDKIKKLQKHQTFQAEIAANQGRIENVKSNGETLIAKNHPASRDIAKRLKDLDDAWRQLLNEVDLRGKGLEEARDILEFNNLLDKIESWIRDKEVMIQAGDVGKDYEHCQALQRKLDDVDSDMRIDDARIKNINSLAAKLSNQGHPGVKERRDAFIAKWQNLQGALSEYRDALAAASEIHLFDRDVADTTERINEKRAAMETDDLGRDLAAVEVLQRKQEAIESEMTAVENKLQDHGRDAIILSDKYPQNVRHLQEKMEALQDQWEKLVEAREKRRNALKNAYARQKFLADVKDLEQWVAETIKRMTAEANQKPNSMAEAEAQSELHDELKAEINGRKEDFNKLIRFGRAEFSEDEDPEIDEGVTKLIELQETVENAWEQRKSDLIREYDLQDFGEQANQLNNWLAVKEAFLNNDDVGDNPRAVEALLRKHEDFEATLNQQLSTRVDDLQNVGDKIISNPGYTSEAVNEVKERLADIISRKNRLLAKASDRKKILNESKAFQKFLKNVYDVEIWLNQKLQIADDENYREPHNLQNKIQKHATFEAEVLANDQRISNVAKEGRQMIQNQHYASEEIAARLTDLENDRKQLIELSNLKRDRLNEAYQASLFYRSLDEFEAWLSEIESQVHSTDAGRDLATVTNLLKRHTALENDVQQHTDNCETINEIANQFVKSGHFMSNEIHERADNAITRYHRLKEPLQRRRDLLESALMLQQFTRDVDDELQWLEDKEPLAASRDLGNSLTAVQSLYKKHQTLEAELSSREPIVGSLGARAAHLATSGHRSATSISEKAAELQQKLANVRDLASIRRLRLQDALEVQTYYEEAAEAEAWMHDKRPSLVTKEVGKDEDSAQSLQRKLEALILEVKSFESVVNKLSKTADNLIERQHYDTDNIELKKKQIEDEFEELRKRISEREVRLSEALQYFGFIRECNEVQEWMKDQITKADSEEYGNDVEHVELLIQAFDTFHAGLMNSEPRVYSCIQAGNLLIEAKSSHSSEVQKKVSEVKNQWEDLLELANARKDALAGAKQVHVFDRTAEEVISWIQEKEADLSYDTYGQDLESIRDLIRKHEAFENEMKAIKDKVEYIEQEGEKLISEFPDTKEHIDDKREDTLSCWEDLQTKTERRKDHLQQAEQLQTYFDQHQDLLAWINEMLAKITAPDLPNDSAEAELLIERHKEHRVEIDARSNVFKQFYESGDKFIKEGHFLADEIQEKINLLKQRMKFLIDTWESRRIIYNQNLDIQLFKREANVLENWLIVRESTLKDRKVGDNILQVEDLIRKHKDFEEAIKAQEDKFEALKRMTMIEEAFALQKEQEALARKAERERAEQERLEQRRKLEIQRIAELRRQERQHEIPEDRMNGTDVQQQQNVKETLPHPIPTITVRKTNSIAQMFDRDRIARRGSDGSVKRAESMKVGASGKPPKRTPSFTTRRRGSFKRNADVVLPPVEAESFLERKQLLIPGSKRASNRTWKHSYTVLCGQLLCFFKNKDDFAASKASCPPINIYNAICGKADDYQKKKYTFRLSVNDGSEFLFACSSELEMSDWIQKINFRAKLPPSQQLLHFDVPKDNNEFEMSSQSSRTSSPDVGDQVLLRHDHSHHNNGNISNISPPHRHSLGESRHIPPAPLYPPPPLPPTAATLPLTESSLNNHAERRIYYQEHSGRNFYDAPPVRHEWQPPQQSSSQQQQQQRPASMLPGDGAKMSHRIRDLFVRKKRNSQM